jgi:hypothetical protein
MFILDKLNISNIKSSDPSFSTQQNTYNFCVVKNTSGVTVSKFFKQMRKRQNDRAHSWLDTGASIKSGRIKLVLCEIIAIYCVAGTAASTGTSVRNIDRGNQHDNNTTTHNGFIAYIFFLKWYYSVVVR